MAFDPETAGIAVASPVKAFDPETAGTPSPGAIPIQGAPRDGEIQPTFEEQIQKERDAKNAEFAKANKFTGDPLESLPASTRALASFESDPAKKAAIVASRPGVLATRPTEDGKNLIVTLAGDGGTPREVLLDPRNPIISPQDIAGSAFPLAKAGAAAGIAYGTGGLSLLPQALAMGGGMALAQAAGQGGARALANQPLDPKDLAINAGKEGALNAALPLAGAAGSKAAGFVGGLYRKGIGAVEQNAAAAAKALDLPLSASLATGSPALVQAEKVAGTTGFKQEQAALAAAKAKELGLAAGKTVPTEAEIADQVKPIIAADAAAAKSGVDAAATDAQQAASARIQAQLDSNLVPPAVSQTDAGGFIRGKIVAARDAFKAEADKNYGKLYELADKEGLEIPTDPLTKLVQTLKTEDPHGAVEQIVPEVRRIAGLESKLNPAANEGEAIGLFDGRGNPIRSAPEVPPPVTLQQAIKVRAVINDAISQGEALGNIPGSYLKRLAQSLTDAIDQGVKTGSADLQAAAKRASDAYAEGAKKLEAADVGKLFKNPDTGAAVGDSEIIPRLFAGKGDLDALTKLKAVLGAGSNDYKLLQRQGLQSIIEASPGKFGGTDAGTFLGKLETLSPDMAAELGPVVQQLKKTGTLLAKAQGIEIPDTVLADALASSPGQAATKLTDAIAKEQAFNQTYQTGVMKGLRDGTVDPQTISADKFVRHFLNSADAAQTKSALAQIGAKSPETVEAIRQRALQNILDEAGGMEGQKGLTQNLDPRVLGRYASDPTYAEALGPKGTQFLSQMQDYAIAQEKRAGVPNVTMPTAHGSAKEVVGAANKSPRDLAGTLYNLATAIPKWGLGKSLANDAVKTYFETGQLPNLSRITKGTVLAAPEAIKAEEAVRRDRTMPLMQNGKLPSLPLVM